MLTGFSVYTFPSLWDWRNLDWEWRDSVGSAAQVMPLLHQPSCGGTYVYEVEATWSTTAANGQVDEHRTYESPPIRIDGSPCPRGAAVRFRLLSLTVDGASDVDGLDALCFFCAEDRTLEGYGEVTLSVRDAETGEFEEAGRYLLWGDLCGTVSGVEICPFRHTRSVRDGGIDFADETRLWSCDPACSSDRLRTLLVFPIYTGEEIWVRFTLRDEDDTTGDDIFCRGEHSTGGISVQQQRDNVGELKPFDFLSDSSETGTRCVLHLEYEYLVIFPAEEN
jgi:hypothetical protein